MLKNRHFIRGLCAVATLLVAACSGASHSSAVVPKLAQEMLRPAGLTTHGPLAWFNLSRGIANQPAFEDAYDPSTQSVLQTFNLNVAPIPPVPSPVNQTVFIAYAGYSASFVYNSIAEINTQTFGITNIHLPGNIQALTVSPNGQYLYALSTKLYKINVLRRTIVATGGSFTAPQSLQHTMVISPDGLTLYLLNQTGFVEHVTAVNASSLATLNTFTVPSISTGLAFAGGNVFVPNIVAPNHGALNVYDPHTGVLKKAITLPHIPFDIVSDPAIGRVFVSSDQDVSGTQTIEAYNASTYGLLTTASVSGVTPLSLQSSTHALWYIDGNGTILTRLDESLCSGAQYDISGLGAGVMNFALNN